MTKKEEIKYKEDNYFRLYKDFKNISNKFKENNYPYIGVGLYSKEEKENSKNKGYRLNTHLIPLEDLHVSYSLKGNGILLQFPMSVFCSEINKFKNINQNKLKNLKDKLNYFQKILGGTEEAWNEVYSDLDNIISFSWTNFFEK